MKIDNSRFTLFWANPDRYRLRELWRLSPEEPKAGTFAALLCTGRRRGTCMHEFLDARYRGVDPTVTVEELKAGGFTDREIEKARKMAEAVRDEETLACEVLFEHPIADGKHIMTGRIDRIIRREDEVLILDYKSSKERTKKEIARKLNDYCASSQVGFYYLGAISLGFQPAGFSYCLVEDRKSGVQVHEQRTHRTSLELKVLERSVAMTCELIEHWKERYGIENPWPVLPEPFSSGYEPLLGRKQYREYLPEGFTTKIEHLESMRDEAESHTER